MSDGTSKIKTAWRPGLRGRFRVARVTSVYQPTMSTMQPQVLSCRSGIVTIKLSRHRLGACNDSFYCPGIPF